MLEPESNSQLPLQSISSDLGQFVLDGAHQEASAAGESATNLPQLRGYQGSVTMPEGLKRLVALVVAHKTKGAIQ